MKNDKQSGVTLGRMSFLESVNRLFRVRNLLPQMARGFESVIIFVANNAVKFHLGQQYLTRH